MTIVVDIDWIAIDYPNQAKAFTVSTYSKQNLEIKNYSD